MKNKNILSSLKNALNGICIVVVKEINMIVHIIIMSLVIILGLYYSIKTYEWLTCIILFSLVIGSEIFNTSIENVVDIASPKYSELAKISKDTSAGAVLIFATASVICGLIIFVPYIFK